MASEPYTASERALPREAAAILHRSHWLYEERAPEERLSRTASARERAQASSTRIVRASCDATRLKSSRHLCFRLLAQLSHIAAHDGRDLLDRRRIRRVAHPLVARRRAGVKLRQPGG